MGKLYVRVDDRLIHGQIVTAWAINLGIKKIIAVDDTLASNPMLKSIMTMAAPKEYSPEIITANEVQGVLQANEDKTVLLIVRQIRNLDSLIDLIKNCEDLNLGNISLQDNTVKTLEAYAGRTFSLTKEDVETLDKIIESGITVMCQLVPSEKRYEYSDLKVK